VSAVTPPLEVVVDRQPVVDRPFTRRRLLGTLGAGAALAVPGVAALGACSTAQAPRSTGTKTIKMSWWGSTERHVRTQDALAAFTRKHTDIKVDTQFSGSDGYWEKLGNQATSGGLPDVIQMDYTYIRAYAGKGWIRPLDDMVPKVIDLGSFSADVLTGGKIDNRLYGVNNGINCTALVCNVTMLQQLGLELPDYTMTWTDFAKLIKQVGKKTPDGVYGSEYAAQNATALETWLRQHGKALYSPDNKLGFTPADMAEWLAFWDDIRKAKGAAPADLQATAAGDIQNRLVARRKTAFDFTNSNQLIAYSSMVSDQLTLHMYPQGSAGSKPGQYLKPSQLFCVAATSKHPTESGMLINGLLTDPDMTAILGSERGIPPSTTVRAALKPKAGATERATYDYIDYVTDKVGPLPPPAPNGGGDVTGKILTAAAQSVAFGKATIDQAVAKFFDDAGHALSAKA
jgi:multiple sugar transport system substrate-binding protein